MNSKLQNSSELAVRRYIEEYEDAPNWGGPTMYPDRPKLADLKALLARLEQLERALTPSAETKAAYIGEFSFTIDEQSDDAMCEVTRKLDVPWTTIKEIMAAIRTQSGNQSNGRCDGEGSPKKKESSQ